MWFLKLAIIIPLAKEILLYTAHKEKEYSTALFFVAVPNIIIIIAVAAAAVGVAWAGSGGAGKWAELWSLWLCAFFAPSQIPV